MNEKEIRIEFKGMEGLNGELLAIKVASFNDAIKIARGDMAALQELDRFIKEAGWALSTLIYEAKTGKRVPVEKSEVRPL